MTGSLRDMWLMEAVRKLSCAETVSVGSFTGRFRNGYFLTGIPDRRGGLKWGQSVAHLVHLIVAALLESYSL